MKDLKFYVIYPYEMATNKIMQDLNEFKKIYINVFYLLNQFELDVITHEIAGFP